MHARGRGTTHETGGRAAARSKVVPVLALVVILAAGALAVIAAVPRSPVSARDPEKSPAAGSPVPVTVRPPLPAVPPSAIEALPEPPRPVVRGRPVSELVTLAHVTDDPWVKADIIEELTDRKAREAIPEIAWLLRDSDDSVRHVAADALAQLGADEQVGALRMALASETNARARRSIEQALHELAHE